MEMIPIIGFLVFFILFLSVLFTTKGRNMFVRIATGGKIVKDYGMLAEGKISSDSKSIGLPQHFRLLKLHKKNVSFYVLEVKSFSAVTYWRLPKEVAKEFAQIVEEDIRDGSFDNTPATFS